MERYLEVQSPIEKILPIQTSAFGDEDRKYSVSTRGKFDLYSVSVFSNNFLYDKYFILLVPFKIIFSRF